MAWLICFLVLLFVSLNKGLLSTGSSYSLLQRQLAESRTSITVSEVITKWIEQPLDHFNTSVKDTWHMRYFERVDLWKPGSPIFILIGGEAESDPVLLTKGMIYDLASETNGAMFMSEHRFYGASYPVNQDASNFLENLKTLSARQALADLSLLISDLKNRSQFRESKVVVIGGSYAGNLAAWMKLLYPDLIDAAISSSAPVLAKQNFFEYLETVTDVYEQYGGEECFEHVKAKFERFTELLKSEEGIATLKRENDICEEVDMTKDVNQHYFAYLTAGTFMYTAQYGNEEAIKSHCDFMLNNTSDRNNNLLDEFFILDSYFRKTSRSGCFSRDFDDLMSYYRESKGPFTSWVWQKCTEFSYAKTTSSPNQIFSSLIPLETFYKVCTAVFGENYGEVNVKRSVEMTNKLYGGRTPDVKHVVFVNGDMDPWHRLGVLKNISDDAPAILIPGSSHCRDLFPNMETDPEELKEARKKIKYLIKSWIGYE